MCRISIIIPVYNAEKSIENCVNSIKNDGFEDIEIILINDGSTDNSLNVCNELKKKDSRIKVLNQENKGAGPARNLGLSVCKGEYIGFLDSDDEVELNYFKVMYEYAKKNNSDIVMSDVNIIKKNGQSLAYLPFLDNKTLDKKEIEMNYIPLLIGAKSEKQYDKKIVRAMWCRIFSRSLIVQNNLNFPCIKNGQDMIFTLLSSISATKITICKKIKYNYHYESLTSLSKSYDKDRFKNMIKFENIIYKILEDSNLLTLCKNEYIQMCRHDIYWILRMIIQQNDFTLKQKKKEIRKILYNQHTIGIFKDIRQDMSLKQKVLYFLIKYKQSFVLAIVISILEG